MIFEGSYQFSSDGASPKGTTETLTVGVGTHAFTDEVDFGVVGGQEIGEGREIEALITIKAAVTSAGAALVNFKWMTHTATGVDAGVILAETGPIPKALLVVGAQFSLKIPRAKLVDMKRWLGIGYEVVDFALILGSAHAGVPIDIQTNG